MTLTGFLAFFSLVGAAQYSERVKSIPGDSIQSERAAVAEIIFGDDTIPQFQIDAEVNKYYSVFSKLYNFKYLKDFHMGTVNLKHGFTSRIPIFHPIKRNGLKTTIIYHTGHGFSVLQEDLFVNFGSEDETKVKVIDFFLSKGFDVVGIDMPMFGLNKYPIEVTEDSVVRPMYGHDGLFNLKNPFYYFMAPIRSVIDFLEQQDPDTDFVMMGLSGGGWSATVYSAMDTRIKLSFPVAGSIPLGLRTAARDLGDLEQTFGTLYDKFNYSTLYFLGAAGEGRMQYQILNRYDPCCFAFDGKQYWVDSVQHALQRVNDPGKFEFLLDSQSTTHRVSASALDTIYYNVLRYGVLPNYKPSKIRSSRVVNSICDNDTLLLSLSEEASIGFEWFRNGEKISGETNTEYVVHENGTYSALVFNVSGAEAFTDTVVIRQKKIFQKPVITPIGNILVSSYSSGTHRWFRDGEPVPGVTRNKLVANVPGRYTVKVENGNCVSDLSDGVDCQISVFPNPARSELNIRSATRLGALKYSVYNFMGQAVASGNFLGETKIVFGPGLRTGYYFLKLTGEKQWKSVVNFWIR